MSDSFFENNLWVEKYRPQKIDQLVLEKSASEKLHECINKKELLNLLFFGPPGTGKSTISRILIDHIMEDEDNVMRMNGSLERSLDHLRNKITNFLSTPPFGNDKVKVVYIDEADGLTSAFQDALRSFIEERTKIARFIFTCNYIQKIPSAIQSRFARYELKPLEDQNIINLCHSVLQNEGISFNPDDVWKIINQFKPDIRSILQKLQQYSSNGKFNMPSMEELIPVEDNLSKISIELFKAYLKKNPTYMTYLERIQQLTMNKNIDYVSVFTKIFSDQDLPIICKVSTNKYCNSMSGAISFPMHYMAYIYETLEMCKAL